MTAPAPRPVLVVDFGAQYAQLIARRVREAHVYSEIVPHSMSLAEMLARDPVAIVLSGGPSSVYADGAPAVDPGLFDAGVPVFGICYGFQAMALALGGRVERTGLSEFGRTPLSITASSSALFAQLPPEQSVWMSHGDSVSEAPDGFVVTATTAGAPVAAMEALDRRLAGVQFHPEVLHSEHGQQVLEHFLRDVAGLDASWTMRGVIDDQVARVREQVGDGLVICGLSGGVDSAVAAALVQRAVGDQLTCVFVDHGLLRAGEAEQVERDFASATGVRLVVVDAQQRFLDALAGVSDPEQKRKIIGREFIRVFEDAARDIVAEAGASGRTIDFLVQGTLYPFPGPGLAIRIVGAVDADRLRILRAADAIAREELTSSGLDRDVWQFPVVLLADVRSVGVQGDGRTYGHPIVLRPVSSEDAMTADWSRLPYELIARISTRITNEVRDVNRVVLDVTSKPPGTIEWE